MSEDAVRFRIGEEELRRRRRNLAWGLLLSALLAGIIAVQNYRYPQQYNDVLMWSVAGFVVLANLVNYLRHRRYLRLAREHYLEVLEDRLRFFSGGELSELELGGIAALRFFRRRGVLGHIQILLTNQRGVRLEGYQDMEQLGERLAGLVPQAKIIGRGP